MYHRNDYIFDENVSVKNPHCLSVYQTWLETEWFKGVECWFDCCQQTHAEASTRTQSQRMMMMMMASLWSLVWQTAGSGVTFSPSISVHCSSLCRLYVSFVRIYPVKQFLSPDCGAHWALLLPRSELSSLYLSDPWHTLTSCHFLSEKSVTPSHETKLHLIRQVISWSLVSFPWAEKTLLQVFRVLSYGRLLLDILPCSTVFFRVGRYTVYQTVVGNFILYIGY